MRQLSLDSLSLHSHRQTGLSGRTLSGSAIRSSKILKHSESQPDQEMLAPHESLVSQEPGRTRDTSVLPVDPGRAAMATRFTMRDIVLVFKQLPGIEGILTSSGR